MEFLNNIGNWFISIGNSILEKIMPFCLIVGIGILVIQLVLKLVGNALERSKLEKAAHTLIKSLLRIALYLILALIAADKLGINVSSVIALASVLTLAISLAVQNALSNVIGGFTLLWTKPFKSGDFVEIAGESGTVMEITMTYTKLCTGDNKLIYIPNSSVVATDIVNFSASGTRRVEVTVSASYDAPTEQVMKALREAAEHPAVLAEPGVFAGISTYGDSAITYVLRAWCKTEDYWDLYFAMNSKVRETFANNGVEMTYPHINVHLDK